MKPNSGANLDHLQNESNENVGRYDPLIGTILAGHLELLSRIGMGGMSVVYKAKDLLLNRMVAVKILLPHVAFDPRGIRRFRQEALAVSKLDHPNIIRVYEFQIPEDGQPFLVMDLVEGEGLDDFINKNGPIESRRAISLLAQVCVGLEHAHKYGVIHRDLKPGNIMLLKDPESKRQVVKIVDFGLAKLLQDETDTSQGLTRTGDIFGSPLYMSPEQCTSASLDVRSDVYSLGCVMYEMLTGQPPFRGKTVLETIQMQISQYPPPLSQVNPRIKMVGRLDSVLFKAIAKDPAQRYQSIEEFRHALEDIKISAPKDGFFDKLKLTLQIRQSKARPGSHSWLKTLMLLGGATFLLMFALLILIIATHNNGPPPNNFKEELRWLDGDQQAQVLFDEGNHYEEVERIFSEQLEKAKHLDPKYEKASLEGLLDVCTVMNKTPDAEWSRRYAALHDTMLDYTHMETELLKVQDAKEAKDTISKSIVLANSLKKAERSWFAEKMLNFALNLGTRFLDPKDPILAECKSAQADMHKIQESSGDKELGLRKQAESIYESNGQNSLAFANAQKDLADIYFRKGLWAEAKSWSQKAIETFKNLESVKREKDRYCGEIARCEFRMAMCADQLKDWNAKDLFLKQSRADLKKLTPTTDLDELSAHRLQSQDWSQLNHENWNLWADLERVKLRDDNNKLTIHKKIVEYLTKALAATNSEPEKSCPEILRCENSIADELVDWAEYKQALPRQLHCLAVRTRLGEPVRDQIETLEKVYECYAGQSQGQDRGEDKNVTEQAFKYANILVNAGVKKYYSNLAHLLLKLKMDKAVALQYSVTGFQYEADHHTAIVKKLENKNKGDADMKEDDDIKDDDNDVHASALRFLYANMVFAEACATNGNVSMATKVYNEATKYLAPYSLKLLANSDGKTRFLFRQATDLKKQVQLQLSSKN